MRVLVVTNVHTPLDARIHQRQIRSMVGAGFSVTYAAPWRATGTLPADAGSIRTLDLPRAEGRRRLRALFAAARLLRREAPRHDVVLLHDPELAIAALGLRRTPVVVDIHEDLGASLIDRSYVPARARRLVAAAARGLERLTERRYQLILAEAAYAERFRRAHPVVRNLPWVPPDVGPAGSERRVVYVGRISAGRGVHELLELGRRLSADGIEVELIGAADADVRDRLEAGVRSGDVVWRGFVPNEAALARLDGALAGLSMLHDLPNYRVSMPTKLVEYLAHGLPVVTTPLPAAGELIRRSAGGFVVPFGGVDEAEGLIRRLDAEPGRAASVGRSGRSYVLEHLSWDTESARLLETLRNAAGPAR